MSHTDINIIIISILKLIYLFYTYQFIIETSDKSRKLKYKQVFTNNMRDKTTPDVTPCNNTDDYTSITFYPDLSKFKMVNYKLLF